MSWKISPGTAEILRRAGDYEGITREDALALLRSDLSGADTYALMATANHMSREMFGRKGENHLHIGINVQTCRYNCSFCSLALTAGIFKDSVEFGEDEIRQWANAGQDNGADALNLMTTGTYSFGRLLEVGRMLAKETAIPLVANTRDINHREGEMLLDAGFVGAYHAVRLGEGKDTPFEVSKRIRTIQVLKDVGLRWMNCIEPVGPEHTHEEILDLMLLARKYRATYSGVMRRINFPGSPMERYGMISELEMAKMVAVSRLCMGDVPKAHCTHEPNAASLFAGANLFFPEVGSSPRDREPDTGRGRGRSLAECKSMQLEMGWDPDLPSNCFTDAPDSLPHKEAIG
jgi:biotin synthase